MLCHTSSPHLHSSLWPGVSSSCSKLFLIFQGFKFPSCAPKTGLGLPGGSPGTPRTALFSSSWGTRDFISLTDLSLPMAGAMPESRDLGSTGLWSRGPQRSPSPPWHTGTRGFLYCAFEKWRLREATEHAKVTHLAWQALVALAGCRGAGGGRGTAVPMLAVHVQTVSRSRARVGDFSLALLNHSRRRRSRFCLEVRRVTASRGSREARGPSPGRPKGAGYGQHSSRRARFPRRTSFLAGVQSHGCSSDPF